MQLKSCITKTLLASGVVLATAIGSILPAQAFVYKIGASSETTNSQQTGAAAEIEFDFIDLGNNKVQIDFLITNTTGNQAFGAGADESQLTGIAFDMFDDLELVTKSTGSALDTWHSNVSIPGLSVSNFDFGFADNGNFVGGNARDALSEGNTDATSVVFSGLDGESVEQFTARFQEAIATGELNIAARFQSVNAGAGSDKLLGGTVDNWNPDPTTERTEIPEPGNVLGLGLAAGILVLGVKKRRSQEQTMLTA